MILIPRYQTHAEERELDVEVTGAGSDAEGPFARVTDSILFPGGGGQPVDHGVLGGVAIQGVERVDGGFVLRLAAPVAQGTARMVVDWERRFDHMQQHTAQHLLTAVASDQFGWDTTSFHLGSETCDIELDTPSIALDDLARLEDAVMEQVRAAIPVKSKRVSLDEYNALDVRSRGLPAGHTGDVRLVEIEGVDVTTCGGTHLSRTSEIESTVLLSVEGMRGGTRVHWVAGRRVRRRLRGAERRNQELRQVLGAADDDLVAAATSRSEQLKDAMKTARRLESELAVSRARGAAVSDRDLVHVHLDPGSAGGAQATARAFVPLAGRRVGVFTCDTPKGPFLVVAAGQDFQGDIQALGARISRELGGGGGGSGAVFQGRAASLDTLDSVLEAVQRTLESVPDSGSG
jgi:alanyl-tRNA synthetase